MRILLTGGTGFVGTALTKALKSQGHETVLLTRRDAPLPGMALSPHWLDGVDAVVNMAGESIAGSRWTTAYKQKITIAGSCSAGRWQRHVATSPGRENQAPGSL